MPKASTNNTKRSSIFSRISWPSVPKFLIAKYTINWTKVNNLMTKLIQYFPPSFKKDKTLGTRIKNWYEQMKGSKKDVLSREMSRWIIKGAPLLKKATAYLFQDAAEWEDKSIESFRKKKDDWKLILKNSITLKQFVIEMLGCSDKIGNWYIGLLELISKKSTDPQLKRSAKNIYDQMFMVCMDTRLLVNKARTIL